MGGVVCIAVLLLAACGATTTSGIGSKRGQPTTTSAPTATAAATASATTTLNIPSGVTSCGAVFNGAAGTTPASAHDSEGCFYRAYQSCHPAALQYTDMGVDTQTGYLFVVQPGANGACSVSASIKYTVCCGGPSRSGVVTYNCAGVTQSNGAYIVQSCAQRGNITLP
jgi:hypothetical protein